MVKRLQIVDLVPDESYWVLRSGIDQIEWYVYRPILAKFIRFSKNDQPYFQTQLGPASSLATESLATLGWQGSAIFPTSFFHYYEDLPTDKMRYCVI
jgi:hypothetical protein